MSDIKRSECATIILAGGNSTRMGTDKFNLILNDMSVLERTIHLAFKVSIQVVVMTHPEKDLPVISISNPSLHFFCDGIANRGPMQGLADGISHIPDNFAFVFVMTCDLPFIEATWMLRLQQEMNSSLDGCATITRGRVNPLLAIYRYRALEYVPELLKHNVFKPIRLFDHFNIACLQPESTDEEMVADMNTMESYLRARQIHQKECKKKG